MKKTFKAPGVKILIQTYQFQDSTIFTFWDTHGQVGKSYSSHEEVVAAIKRHVSKFHGRAAAQLLA